MTKEGIKIVGVLFAFFFFFFFSAVTLLVTNWHLKLGVGEGFF